MAEKTDRDIEMKLIKKSSLAEAVSSLQPEYTVLTPEGDLAGATPAPPKEHLFPRSETLYDINLSSGNISLPEQPGPVVLFGVRPCDARSLVNLDCVFLEKPYEDKNYAQRREILTVITLACAVIPYPACFCDSMGGGPAGAEGADILLRETKDGVAWLASFITEKGRAIEAVWQSAGLLSAPGKVKPAPIPACPLKIEKPDDLAAKLKAAWDDPAWGSFSEACLGCGVCSFLCPTCYCFDIDAEVQDDTAAQFRCWDCCMFSDYSRMAGGHNPRPTKKERLRNRYMHKLVYFDERYGRTLCVGCGRCISKCPAGLDIASVIEWGGEL